MGREQWIAWIAEDIDDDERGPIAVGLFSGHLEGWGHGESADAPEDESWSEVRRVPADAAVAWARERAARVVVRVCDSWENTHYSAGEERLIWDGKPLPLWDEAGLSLEPRRLPEWEFVDRTEAEEAISWDVFISGTQLGGRAVPAFASRWRQALATDESLEIMRFEEDPTHEDAETWPDRANEHGLSSFSTYGARPARAVIRLTARTVEEARRHAIQAAEHAARAALTELEIRVKEQGLCDWSADAFPSGSRWAANGLL